MQQAPKFTAKHCQSNGLNQLKRMEWEFNGVSYKFALNPEEFSQSEPNRVTVTQTKGGAWSDSFGGGIQTITIKGTTGFKNNTGDNNKGFSKMKELRDLIRTTYFYHTPGSEITKELTFHNHTDGESWIVIPKVFNLMRSVARPLLYMYDIQLICVRPANQPKPSDYSTNTSDVYKLQKVN